MLLCFCLVKLQKCLKMLVFFQVLGGFVGWLILVYLGLEGLVAFVFLVFDFLFGVGFVSVCLLCVVLWLDIVVPVSVFFLFCVFVVCFLLVFLFAFFVFFGGFKGQVWPKGPPHLALNCFFFVFLFVFVLFCVFCLFLFVFLFFFVFVCFCLFFLEGLRVR